jgi:hypothetical protein
LGGLCLRLQVTLIQQRYPFRLGLLDLSISSRHVFVMGLSCAL